jgi:hypothetical protein
MVVVKLLLLGTQHHTTCLPSWLKCQQDRYPDMIAKKLIISTRHCHNLFLLFCIETLSQSAHIVSIHCCCLLGFCCNLSIKGVLKYCFSFAIGHSSCTWYNRMIASLFFLLELSSALFSMSSCKRSFLFCHSFSVQ